MMENTPFGTTYTEEIYSVRPPLTVILDTPWSSLTPECQELLSKILGAVGQSTASVRLVCQDSLNISKWAEQPLRLVAFVPPPKGVALNERIETPTTQMVVTEPLQVLLSNETIKRQFWAAFKTLFIS